MELILYYDNDEYSVPFTGYYENLDELTFEEFIIDGIDDGEVELIIDGLNIGEYNIIINLDEHTLLKGCAEIEPIISIQVNSITPSCIADGAYFIKS